ncbi:MAG: hypothetical protein OXR68_04125 [Alphaproteobacteria bacterium]|nr:hypothetical protein [Alphaproteobacteria bacterium]MDD9919794.1 hypothetical protein [Alphaproteobacteria bacterium]
MITAFFKADTQKELEQSLPEFTCKRNNCFKTVGYDADGNRMDYDYLGNIILQKPVFDTDGNLTAPPTVSTDIHANVRCSHKQAERFKANPYCIGWAGDGKSFGSPPNSPVRGF